MTSRLLGRCLGLGPIRRIVEHQGANPNARRIFDRLSGAGRVYQSLEDAREGIRRYLPETLGHLDEKLVGWNFAVSSQQRLSDYPVLYWLLHILSEERIKLMDFGGGVGQTFVNFRRFLPSENLDQWIVQDLPDVIAQVNRGQFSGDPSSRLGFTSKLSDGSGCNTLLAAGSLHYWSDSMREFFQELGTCPRHFIVNRSPMQESGETYFTVQEGADWAVPCKVRSLAGLSNELKSEGYTLVDSWIDTEKRLLLPWLPAYSCEYRGAYFRRES